MVGCILGLYRDNGKENQSYYSIIGRILGLYRDNENENGNYHGVALTSLQGQSPTMRYRSRSKAQSLKVQGLGLPSEAL